MEQTDVDFKIVKIILTITVTRAHFLFIPILDFL